VRKKRAALEGKRVSFRPAENGSLDTQVLTEAGERKRGTFGPRREEERGPSEKGGTSFPVRE